MHGWGGNLGSLKPVADRLSRSFTVTLVEFPAGGNEGQPDRVLTLSDFVDGVLGLVSLYNMSTVTLVGHSFGGRVALLFASLYGHILDKLVLISSAGLKPRRGLRYYCSVYAYKLRKLLKLPQKNSGSADYRQLNSPAEKGTFVGVINTFLDDKLKKITAKTLLIWGKDDRETPLYMAKRLHKKLYFSVLRVLPTGHFSYATHADEVTTLIEAFLV